MKPPAAESCLCPSIFDLKKKGIHTLMGEITLIIPVYRPDEKFQKLLQSLKSQTVQPDEIILMNTEERYWKPEWITGLEQAKVVHLTREEFDHGKTRDQAARMSKGEILIFMTQDAVPADAFLFEKLLEAFREDAVKAAYARQLPDKDCRVVEQYTRSFNYPKESRLKGREDLPKLGIKTFFCSNVCAAYEKKTYLELGGFPKNTIFNEDMIFAGGLIQAGFRIAYAADAKVVHSHNYNNIQQFRRNFDLAVSQAEHPEVFARVSSEQEGIRLVKKTAGYLCSIHKPWLIPGLIMQSGCKYLGYRLGKAYKKLPRAVILRCTMNKAYWTRK